MRVKWKDWLDIVKEELPKIGMQKLAEKIGCSTRNLSQQMALWRKAGHQLQNGHIKPIVKRTINGITYCYKTENGKTISLGREDGKTVRRGRKRTKIAEPKVEKASAIKKPTTKEIRFWKKLKKQDAMLPTRHIDYSKLKSVRIDRRTSIFVPLEMSEEEAVNNYYKKREKKC